MNARIVSVSALMASLALAACSQETADVDTDAAAPPPAEDGSETELAAADADSWSVPRTALGDPDLRGMWPLDSLAGTPIQRPEAFGDRAELTDEEYDQRLNGQLASGRSADREEEAAKLGTGHWFELGGKPPLRQTSLIVEPANGRMPGLTDEGERLSAAMKSSWSESVFEDLSDFNVLDRCITRGLPASMTAFPYNNGWEIYQSPGYVVIRQELIHETRIIPLDGRPPLPDVFRPWLGESRGHWEGDALVIETTNFTGETPMNIVGPGNKPIPTSAALHVTERLEMTDPDTLQYTMHVEDPVVLTAPWTMSYPLARDESYEIYEYACHEANTVVRNYITSTSPRYIGENEGTFTPQEWLRLQAEGFALDDDDAPDE